ncbi:MAG: ATP-binding protein [Mariprofundaceae bacterium]|nr:ATP-binding protein [Mariprofundaceae bacterium]
MRQFDKKTYKAGLAGLLAIAVGLLYWPFEALIHYIFFDASSFLTALLQPTPNEAWMRGLVVVLFVFFGLFIYRLELRQRDYISELEMLKEGLEHAGEGVIITDGHGVIEYVNQAFIHTTGFSEAEVIGNNPSILQSGKQDASFYHAMWQTIQQQGEWCGRIWNRRTNGEIYPEQLHICAVYGEDGAIRHHVGIFFDLTEQLRLEEQLRESQKLEAIGTLVGGIAHDFNNILTTMTGNLFLVKMELKDSGISHATELQEKLDLIENEGFRAASMIQHLLAFARKGVVQLQPFDLVPSIQGIIDLTRPSIHRSIVIERTIDDDVLQVFGDSRQLEEVVINLLNNAADALKAHDSPHIGVTLTRCDCPDGVAGKQMLSACAKLCVADNGDGIEEADIERIFEPFFTTKDVGEGTGLGLAMVYGAVQIHKGHIEVYSTKGQGTEVVIYLPLHTLTEA